MNLKRGEIVLVDLEPVKGSEQGLKRPAVVIQNDVGNKYSPTTIVAPVTTSYQSKYPVHVGLDASKQSGLKEDSTVLLNQIRTVSIEHRIIEKLGRVSKDKMEEVNKAIKESLALE